MKNTQFVRQVHTLCDWQKKMMNDKTLNIKYIFGKGGGEAVMFASKGSLLCLIMHLSEQENMNLSVKHW